MSDHFDAEDLRTDLTDVYVFPAGEQGRTVLIFCVNPEASVEAVNVDPAASYELKIDTDGDGTPEQAFHVLFAVAGGETSATVYRASGTDAGQTGAVGRVVVSGAQVSTGRQPAITTSGEYRFFAGLRSDPHFKDILGFRNNFQFTGHDPVADRNVFGIALEVPTETFGIDGAIRVWARTVATVDGRPQQVDQAGRPGVNNAFNLDEVDNAAFCRSSPGDQLDKFGDKFLAFLRSLGYDETEARALLPEYLPDWLVYDPRRPSAYPNGRRLTDDTADLLAALLTKGRITSDGVGPHTDLIPDFPYLGPPRPGGAPTV